MTSSNTKPLLVAALAATCILNACYQAKSPDQVAKDTAAAEDKAVQTTAKVMQSAEDRVNNAQGVVRDEQAAAAHTQAEQTAKVTIAAAEGQHRIELAKCESLAGESQKACREQADTAFITAQDQAKQAKADSDPKP